ncbi:DNA ligase [Alteromonas sp.]|uniref:DNA ligase n=1 Tax=Alteromonas sp. TaxID=232 RepID=UPI00257E7C46|nr:DNA ligase [Alteromonas sp.]
MSTSKRSNGRAFMPCKFEWQLLLAWALGILVWIAAVTTVSAETLGDVHQRAPTQTANLYTASHHTMALSDYLISEKLDGIRARWTGTELLTRKGNIIHAPKWFTWAWPNTTLDGELWLARGKFEDTASIVLTDIPDERWEKIKFMVFDMPLLMQPFEQRAKEIKRLTDTVTSPALLAMPQFVLHTHEALQAKLNSVVDAGGEGLMLHHRQARYVDGRSAHLLKLKRHQDSEAKVIAHIKGKGKFKTMMGSLLVERADGVQFKLGSGFSNNERRHPPEIGEWVTYKFYGYTNSGKPRFASFMHIRPEKDLPEASTANVN